MVFRQRQWAFSFLRAQAQWLEVLAAKKEARGDLGHQGKAPGVNSSDSEREARRDMVSRWEAVNSSLAV